MLQLKDKQWKGNFDIKIFDREDLGKDVKQIFSRDTISFVVNCLYPNLEEGLKSLLEESLKREDYEITKELQIWIEELKKNN